MSADSITFAKAISPPVVLAKTITVDEGTITGTVPSPNAFIFAFRTVAIGTHERLCAALEGAAAAGEIAVRGAPKAPWGRRAIHDNAQKGPAGLEVVPRVWCAFDWDGIDPEDTGAHPLHDPEAGARLSLKRLPPAFRDVSCVWQISASAGFKPGFRLRTWHLLDHPTLGTELKTWCRPAIQMGLLDPVTLVEAQPHYLSVRIVGGGDPCPKRFGVLRQQRDLVPVPDIAGIRRRQQERLHAEREARRRRRRVTDFDENAPTGNEYARAKIKECLDAIRDAIARHTIYVSEAARAKGLCDYYGLDWELIREELVEAYESTLTPSEAAERRKYSTESVLDWLENRP